MQVRCDNDSRRDGVGTVPLKARLASRQKRGGHRAWNTVRRLHGKVVPVGQSWAIRGGSDATVRTFTKEAFRGRDHLCHERLRRRYT